MQIPTTLRQGKDKSYGDFHILSCFARGKLSAELDDSPTITFCSVKKLNVLFRVKRRKTIGVVRTMSVLEKIFTSQTV